MRYMEIGKSNAGRKKLPDGQKLVPRQITVNKGDWDWLIIATRELGSTASEFVRQATSDFRAGRYLPDLSNKID